MRRSPQALCPSFGYFLDTPLSLPFGCVRPTSHLRMVDRQQEAWANARTSGRGVPVDCEARWRESLVDVGPPRGRVSQKSVRLASSNMDCVLLEQWCAWFRAQRTLTQKWGAATVVLDVVDFSRNEICDRGLSILVDLLLEQPPRVLRLFRDQISDATPIEKLLAKGSLHELHLSNNQISAASALRIAVSAATAVDKYGTHIYPISDVTLLWLRFENNFGSSNGFARELCQEMCKAKRPEAICFVDGKTSCNPKRCDCPGGPRAVHPTRREQHLQQAGAPGKRRGSVAGFLHTTLYRVAHRGAEAGEVTAVDCSLASCGRSPLFATCGARFVGLPALAWENCRSSCCGRRPWRHVRGGWPWVAGGDSLLHLVARPV